MAGEVVGTAGYPALEGIASLFRSLINDDMQGATDTLGEGQIAIDKSAFMLNFMNAAIRNLYVELRIVGAPALIRDNYIVPAITPVNGPQGLASPSPETQVSLGFNGYFDGLTINSLLYLPADCVSVERIWERTAGSSDRFTPMMEAPFGLSGCQQGISLTEWEWRGDAVWMHGAVINKDLRLRYNAVFPDFFGDTLDFSNTFVPILGSLNAITYDMVAMYAFRLTPEQYPMADAKGKEERQKLKAEIVLRAQATPNVRQPFGSFGQMFPF